VFLKGSFCYTPLPPYLSLSYYFPSHVSLSALKMEGSSKTSESTYKTIWCYNPEDHNQKTHHHENLKVCYYVLIFIVFIQLFLECLHKQQCLFFLGGSSSRVFCSHYSCRDKYSAHKALFFGILMMNFYHVQCFCAVTMKSTRNKC
jgi:hypothetical protein